MKRAELLESAQSALREKRAGLLDDLRRRLHADGQSEQLALVNHLEETGDWSEASSENLHDLALLQHEAEDLQRVDAALARIEAGEYGLCQGCGDAIPAARLAVQPEALLCLTCQEKIEHQQARRA